MEIPRGIEKGCEWLCVLYSTCANALWEERGITDKKRFRSLKGLSHEIEFKFFDKNRILLGRNMNFCTVKKGSRVFRLQPGCH
jgi:hypothetical protein